MRIGKTVVALTSGAVLLLTVGSAVFLAAPSGAYGGGTNPVNLSARGSRGGVYMTPEQQDAMAVAAGGLTTGEWGALKVASRVSLTDFTSSLQLTHPNTLIFLPNMSLVLMTQKAPSKGSKLVFSPITTKYDVVGANNLIVIARRVDVPVRISTAAVGSLTSSLIHWSTILAALILVVVYGRRRYNRRQLVKGSAAGIKKNGGGEIPKTRFTDVVGVNEAVEDLREIVEFLKDPDKFSFLGAKPSRGALLSGPPGTGKTLLAKAVAGEAGVAFFSCVGSEFDEKWVGVGASRVKDLFAKAKACDKAIIFIDEIDAVGSARSARSNDSGDNNATLLQLLHEIDGFEETHVIVLAATNRAEVLDEALTRSGRLERKIEVPAPDRRGRTQLFELYFKGKPISDDVDPVYLAHRTPGMTGADVASIVNEACMAAGRANLRVVTTTQFDAAIETVVMGRARVSALVTESDRTITAWHEAGHTICALLQEDSEDPVSVSIIPRGPAGGVTWTKGSDDQFLSRNKAKAQLVTKLGGRAAEMALMNGEFTQGAANDLEGATNLAMNMVTQLGMTKVGLMVRSRELLATGGEPLKQVIDAVEEMLEDALNKAKSLLAHEGEFMSALVAELLDKETLSYAEIKEIYEVSRGSKKRLPAKVPMTPIYDHPERLVPRGQGRVEARSSRRGRLHLPEVGVVGGRVRKPAGRVAVGLALSAQKGSAGSKKTAVGASKVILSVSKSAGGAVKKAVVKKPVKNTVNKSR